MSREIDALIAKHVMGFPFDGLVEMDLQARYSTEIAAAWEVVEKLSPEFWIKISNGISSTGKTGTKVLLTTHRLRPKLR